MANINLHPFWRGFIEGMALCGAITLTLALIAAILAWQLVFPTIGLLWTIGWLA